MQAPSPPFDITVTFGKQEQTQNLMKFDLSVNKGQDHVKNHSKVKQIPFKEDSPQDLHLIFDLSVEAGREKQAVQYINDGVKNKDDKTRSPIQRAFSYDPADTTAKYSVQAHKGFIRVYYQILAEGANAYKQFVQGFQQSYQIMEIDPTLNMEMQLKGSVSHNKKNRQNVKVDYAKCRILGQKAFTPQLIQMLVTNEIIPEEESMVLSPYLDVIKKVKKLKINLQFDSVRKILRYYNSVAYENDEKQPQTKGFPYTNQGIFRQKAEFTAIFKNQYLINLNAHYQSQDVFIRLIKVYGTLISKCFDIDVFNS